MTSALSEALRQSLLCVSEFVHQLPIRFSLFQHIQVGSLNVFNDRNFKDSLIIQLSQQHRDLMDLRNLGGPPAPFSCDDLVFSFPTTRLLSYDKWLDNSLGFDRSRKLFQFMRRKPAPWLFGIWVKFIKCDEKLALPALRVGLLRIGLSQIPH